MAKVGRARVLAQIKQALGILDHHRRGALKVAPPALGMQTRVCVRRLATRQLGGWQRTEQHERGLVEIPSVDRIQRELEALLLRVVRKGLLREAGPVHEDSDGACGRVQLGLDQHRLQDGEQPPELSAEPIGVPCVEPRVAEHEHANRVLAACLAPLLHTPAIVGSDQRAPRHLLGPWHDATIPSE